MNYKIIIYQVFTRLFSNRNLTRKENGTLAENGCGKMNDFNISLLKKIKESGITHIWYTGLIRHATCTDYSAYGIPLNHPAVVKGKAGSPYAITDYYDVDPDLAVDVEHRMDELESLIKRTHQVGLKFIMDFVPNHVAREYHSIMKPDGVKDLGEDDDTNRGFDAKNNFYYCVGQQFSPNIDLYCGCDKPYYENPAKATGNDRFDSSPGINDWYETVKLNYGIDYCDAQGRSTHFVPTPDTWIKMYDILAYWASKGVDGFRCDMAEMVPTAFWTWATSRIKKNYTNVIFIGEVYDPSQYSNFIKSGFDYLYDKVGMYDTLRNIINGGSASSITYQWQSTDLLQDHLLYFLENHDEQRFASDFFAGDAFKAIPALIVSVFMHKNPFMLYAGQEYGERGMDKEGFSGLDGRTTIFDYWNVSSIYNAFFNRSALTDEQKCLSSLYSRILFLANHEKAISEGEFFDLMYVNPDSLQFNPHTEFAFLRKYKNEVILVVVNFSADKKESSVVIPKHAFEFWGIEEQSVVATDLFTGDIRTVDLKADGSFCLDLEPYSGRAYKFVLKMKEDVYVLNEHNKEEFPPAHTAEHLLNQTMIRMFGCERSKNAHIERKKSKISYILDHKPSRNEEKDIEKKMNELIDADLPVTFEFVDRDHIPSDVSLDKLPADASETLRLVRIGDYDVCPCIGKHVRSTSQIGKFVILGTNWDEEKHSFRIRFKVIQ